MTTLTETTASQTVEPASGVSPASSRTTSLRAVLHGLANGGIIAVMLAMGIFFMDMGVVYQPVLDFVIGSFLGFALVSLFDGILNLLRAILTFISGKMKWERATTRLKALPTTDLGRLLGVIALIAISWFLPDDIAKYAAVPPLLEMFIVVFTLSAGLIAFYRLPGRSAAGRILVVASIVALNAAFLVWAFGPGSDSYVAHAQAATADAQALDLPDPGLTGPYAVRTLSYGSGSDRHRTEYGADVALTTEPVDGSAIFNGYTGLARSHHEWYWGFDFSRLPLNGLVWYPEGEGPFPLVLIVHGNHSMAEASDPGYAYLGEHLAGRGYVVVSVDENFLNGSILADGDMKEMPLRAWLLLKHLQVWRDWNTTPGNPFYDKVDLERVGLIGHSRGGEAVAHAAELNAHSHVPVSEASSPDEFGFGIRGVVALAPCDDRYQPDGRSLKLTNADYLLLATGHDADMYYLDGQGQYNRAAFADNPDGFKALAYLYRGNHGQFNTVWADDDRGDINSWLLNRRAYLSGEEQRRAARVFITSFLNASLRDEREYRRVFYDPESATAWLPQDIIVTQYQDAGFVPVDTNEKGKKDAADAPGGSASAEGMKLWKSAGLQARDGETLLDNRVIYLEWEAGNLPSYTVSIPAGAAAGWSLTPDSALMLSLGNAMPEGNLGEIMVELEAVGGETARLPLSRFAPIHPALPVKFTKADWIAGEVSYGIETARPQEYVLQTYHLPLADFGNIAVGSAPEQLRTIRLVFDGSTAGSVYLDNIGFQANRSGE